MKFLVGKEVVQRSAVVDERSRQSRCDTRAVLQLPLPVSIMSRQKPLFTWRASQGSEFIPHAWAQLSLSVAIQKFFFRLQDERLDDQSAKERYPDEIDAIRASMEEAGVIVVEPKWFSGLFR